MKGSKDVLLPLAVFLNGINEKVINGVLKNLINITVDSEAENYVEGYNPVSECLWPILL